MDAYFTPESTPRKGVAPNLTSSNFAVLDRHNFASWAYYWGPYGPVVDPNSPNFVEYVPMAAGNIRTPMAPTLVAQAATRTVTHNYWLVFNECENSSPEQCNEDPVEVAEFYHDDVLPVVLAIDPQAEFILGGVNAHPCGIRWLREFVEAYENLPGNPQLDPTGWHFHIYPEIYPRGWDTDDQNCEQGATVYPPPKGGNYNGWFWDNREGIGVSHHSWRLPRWEEDMNNILEFVWQYGEPDDEIWITEIGCLTPDSWIPTPPPPPTPTAVPIGCNEPGFMTAYASDITRWFNNEGRWVTRYAWWTDWDLKNRPHTSLYNITLTPTPPGTPTPGPTPTAFATPTPNRSALGNFYAQVQPEAAIALPWPKLWLPLVPNQ